MPTVTDAPDVAKVGASALTFVPFGTVRLIVLADSLIVPDTAGLVVAKEVMAFEEAGVLGVETAPPPPHALKKNVAKASNKYMRFIVIS